MCISANRVSLWNPLYKGIEWSVEQPCLEGRDTILLPVVLIMTETWVYETVNAVRLLEM